MVNKSETFTVGETVRFTGVMEFSRRIGDICAQSRGAPKTPVLDVGARFHRRVCDNHDIFMVGVIAENIEPAPHDLNADHAIGELIAPALCVDPGAVPALPEMAGPSVLCVDPGREVVMGIGDNAARAVRARRSGDEVNVVWHQAHNWLPDFVTKTLRRSSSA